MGEGMRSGSVWKALTAVACLAAAPAVAQVPRGNPMRIIVGAQAGGAADVVARRVGVRLTEMRNQQVVVDNRIGVVGAEITAQAAPDGNTMLFSPDSIIMREVVYEKTAYKTLRDFQPVTLAVVQPNALAVHANLPVKSVQELVALARSKPGQINYGSAGNGSAQHMAGELFRLLAKINVVHVPYKGVPQATADLIGGRVEYVFGSPVSLLPHAKENRVRLLAVTTPKRATSLPDVPTVAESGVPGYEYIGWLGMFVPRATPRAIVDRLQADIARIVHEGDVRQLITSGGTEPLANTPDEFTAKLRSEIPRWARVVKEAGIRVD
ncbi:MAG TPA: tripartite tricarboxylate transporter substrate binding protein [Burkholderiales bacterium]|nr:tripartite tricarboxylate transporter substrate binding protein [Burkholderiales bacterium]